MFSLELEFISKLYGISRFISTHFPAANFLVQITSQNNFNVLVDLVVKSMLTKVCKDAYNFCLDVR